MTELGVRSAEPVTPGFGEPEETGLQSAGSIWPHVDRAIVDEVLRHRSTIVFANSRRLAERLTAAMNEIYVELETGVAPEKFPAQMIGGSGVTARPAATAVADTTRSSLAPTTARCRRSSARSSRTTSSRAACAASSRPRRSSSASTWAPSTW